MTDSRYPSGWDNERIKRVLEHYDAQTGEDAVAEDDATYEDTTHSFVQVPIDLLPQVQNLIQTAKQG